MRKKLLVTLSAFLAITLSACGGGGEGGETSSTTTSSQTSTSTSTSSTTPSTDLQVFNSARVNTVNSIQYEYDFNLTAKIKYKGATVFSPATYSGTTYVNTGNQETQFLQKRSLTGALVIDSTNYIYNIGTDLIKISADEDKDFSVINYEKVDSIYDFDKHNFGHILKYLTESDYTSVKYSNGKYNIAFKTNFNEDSLLGMLNHIDSRLILKALNAVTRKVWGIGLKVNVWATLENDNVHLKTFHFDASVIVENKFEVGFVFEQTFTKYSGVTINTPVFANTLTKETEVTPVLNSVKGIVNTAKTASTSYYDYKVKTTVDHGVSLSNPLGLAVNSTTKGVAKRQVSGNDVFFNNRLEVDSDYKNNDQYGDLVEDYDSYRARLNNSNKDVYDVLDPKVGFNNYTLLEGYNENNIDNYYMLPSTDLFNYSKIKVVKKTTDSKNNTIYKFGLSTEAVTDLLSFYNKSIRIDFKRETIFDIYNIQSDFIAKKALFTYTVASDGRLAKVDIDLKGFYTEKTSEDDVKFRLETSIEFDWSKSYNAATKKEDIDN